MLAITSKRNLQLSLFLRVWLRDAVAPFFSRSLSDSEKKTIILHMKFKAVVLGDCVLLPHNHKKCRDSSFFNELNIN